MLELLNCEKLKEYEATAEGTSRFLKEAQTDDKIQKILQDIRAQLKANGNESSFEPMITYLLGIRHHDYPAMAQRKVTRATNQYRAIRELDFLMGYKGMESLYSQDASIAENMKAKIKNLQRDWVLEDSQDLAGMQAPEHMEFEKDKSLIDFMKQFYKKYCVLYYSESEKCKASKLKVKIKVTSELSIFLTRQEVDEMASRYRLVLKSFLVLKNHIEPEESKMIEANLSIYKYTALFHENGQRLIVDYNSPFKVIWKDQSYNMNSEDQASNQYLKSKIFDKNFVITMRETIDNELSEDKILYNLCKKHNYFIEYVLKQQTKRREIEKQID
jgi:hypothetical protein